MPQAITKNNYDNALSQSEQSKSPLWIKYKRANNSEMQEICLNGITKIDLAAFNKPKFPIADKNHNLDLIINGNKWDVEVFNDSSRKEEYVVSPYERRVIIYNMPKKLDSIKRYVWETYDGKGW